MVALNLKPLTFKDIPDPASPEFATFLDEHFAAGEALATSMSEWRQDAARENGTVKIMSLPTSGRGHEIRKQVGASNDFWCGRISAHTPGDLVGYCDEKPEKHESIVGSLARRLSSGFKRHSGSAPQRPSNERRPTIDLDEVARQERVMKEPPRGIYEQFRRGLLEYHSENEREYIESCRETERLDVLIPHVAEIWRLTYVTPAPASPRTFVVLLLSRELKVEPHGERAFMNISLPFTHPHCQEKHGPEKARVRGKYVSVELVRELADDRVDWRMATSSDAGGSIPRFITNSALPKSIAEDVPSFLRWMVKKYPLAAFAASNGQHAQQGEHAQHQHGQHT